MSNLFKKCKKICVFALILVCICIFCGCSINERTPLSVTFVDVSGAMSADHTIAIKFGEEDNYKDKYIDILVKSDNDDVELTLFQEFASDNDKITLTLNKSTGFVSLDEYKLFNMEKEQTDSMVGYGEVLATNLVVNSNKEATLTFLAVVGDRENGEFKQTALVSKEYTLKVRKKAKN